MTTRIEEEIDEYDESIYQKIATVIRNTYSKERSRIMCACGASTTYSDKDVVYEVTGNKRDLVWLKIAKLVVQKELDPVQYVIRQFHGWVDMKFLPAPNFLLSPKALDKYYKYEECADREAELSLRTMVALVDSRFGLVMLANPETSKVDCWKYVLSDETIPLSGLFRYCVAKRLGDQLDEVAACYEKSAIIEYMSGRKAYDNHWRQLLDKRFVKKAESCYLKLLTS